MHTAMLALSISISTSNLKAIDNPFSTQPSPEIRLKFQNVQLSTNTRPSYGLQLHDDLTEKEPALSQM